MSDKIESNFNELPMNRILSLDGGGVRGFFSLEILRQTEFLLRKKYPDFEGEVGRPLVLADYFNFIGGTSVGAVIASMLSIGMDVEKIITEFDNLAKRMFKRNGAIERHFQFKYNSAPLINELKRIFSDSKGNEILIGSDLINTNLMLTARNCTTGGIWFFTNNRSSQYCDPEREDCNFRYPLWQVVSASAAAPVYFAPQKIRVKNGQIHEFVDGGVGPFNNPALQMYLQGTLPEYGMQMAQGEERLLLVSVGCGRIKDKRVEGEVSDMHKMDSLLMTLRLLFASDSVYQDIFCRALGKYRNCPTDEDRKNEASFKVESELGTLEKPEGVKGLFQYLRYEHVFTDSEIEKCMSGRNGKEQPFQLDSVDQIGLLKDI